MLLLYCTAADSAGHTHRDRLGVEEHELQSFRHNSSCEERVAEISGRCPSCHCSVPHSSVAVLRAAMLRRVGGQLEEGAVAIGG